ncbi:MAG TPA: proline dehydrogenase family protein [Terriglobia bacterium]|nr:proline dehydrogenase family protein [Terriglobia bacterium]
MLRSSLLYLSERENLKRLLTKSSMGRRMAARFIAGENLEDAVRAVRQLNSEGFEVTLDFLGESVHAAAEAENACRVYLGILDRQETEGLRSHISIKPTQLGLALDEALAGRLLGTLAGRAALHHNFVRMDMEGSAHVEGTLRVFHQLNAPRDSLGVVIQSYLYRSEKDVEDLVKGGARVRLVKGAYQEPPDIAFPRKADVDANFVKLMEKLLASGGYHAIATHDPRMIAATQNFARARGLKADQFEFQMLYGIRRQLQRDLLRQGYRVRVYVPYGKEWYAYFMRRLAERPANLFFLIRNFVRR